MVVDVGSRRGRARGVVHVKRGAFALWTWRKSDKKKTSGESARSSRRSIEWWFGRRAGPGRGRHASSKLSSTCVWQLCILFFFSSTCTVLFLRDIILSIALKLLDESN